MNRVFFWSLGLIALLVVMGIAIAMLRKRMSPLDPPMAGGFSLGDLRELHRKGKMTDAEFEAAKNLVLKGLKQSVTGTGKPNRTSGRDQVP